LLIHRPRDAQTAAHRGVKITGDSYRLREAEQTQKARRKA
jgi:hypothetical protein